MEIVDLYEKIEYKCMKEFQTTSIERSVVFSDIVEQYIKYIKKNNDNININDFIEKNIDLKKIVKEAQRKYRKQINKSKFPSFLSDIINDVIKDFVKTIFYVLAFFVFALIIIFLYKKGLSVLTSLNNFFKSFI